MTIQTNNKSALCGLEACKVQLLNQNQVEAFIDLQKRTIEALPPEQKYFLKPRSAEDLARNIQAGQMLGMVLKDKLIGGALIAYPDNSSSDLQYYPLGHDRSVVQSVMTHPAFLRCGVAQRILQEAEKIAAIKFTAMIAKIAVKNQVSQRTFMKAGFELVIDNFLDPQGNYFAGFWKKHIQPMDDQEKAQ